MSELFSNFPKQRLDLPAEYKVIYDKHYKINREGKSIATMISKRMESWMHKKVANDSVKIKENKTLEIGAGTLNHLKYEDNTAKYDIVEPYVDLYKDSSLLSSVNQVFSDISDISGKFEYDRIISIATFEHILNLPDVIYRACVLLKQNGTLRVAIPNEGSFIWKLGWQLSTGIEYKLKYGLDYGVLMKYEHVNTAKEIENILNFFFEKVNCSFSGFCKSLSFYLFFSCSNPIEGNMKIYTSDYINAK